MFRFGDTQHYDEVDIGIYMLLCGIRHSCHDSVFAEACKALLEYEAGTFICQRLDNLWREQMDSTDLELEVVIHNIKPSLESEDVHSQTSLRQQQSYSNRNFIGIPPPPVAQGGKGDRGGSRWQR